MAHYIDGFVFPIPVNRLDLYKELVNAVADMWLEHGALEYREFAADDMNLEGTASFNDAIQNSESETLVFGWVLFESRASRDAVNEKIANDPRMLELMSNTDAGFDPGRMAYGGFQSLISKTKL